MTTFSFRKIFCFTAALILSLGHLASAKEFHVSQQGDDQNDGSAAKPLHTIQAAATLAQPGDSVTVHAGTYREWVNPPRGGSSADQRITYQSAPGEKAIIKGSEVVTGWTKVQDGVWKVGLPDSFFKGYNPYAEVMKGDWFDPKGLIHHPGEVFINGEPLHEAQKSDDVLHAGDKSLWACTHEEGMTTLWANFVAHDPNAETAEISVRKVCFYPDQPGRNYITVRGFTMAQAATPWAPPTREQMGLLGVHWSKGWIIENNVISDAKSTGITLGKDSASDVTKLPYGADSYNQTVKNAEAEGWSKETIGSHIVRNNTIFNCGQAGICGSLGAIFSRIEHNNIYHINRDVTFGGAEMAGIKIHAAVDLLVKDNWIHDCSLGLWFDWMAQGARVTGNLFSDNDADLFFEVDHGPYLIDHNVLMSGLSLSAPPAKIGVPLLDKLFRSGLSFHIHSDGGAFVHNIILSGMQVLDERKTPYFDPHSTHVAGVEEIAGGDDRFFNNIFWNLSLGKLYENNKRNKYQPDVAGNLYGPGATPYGADAGKMPASTSKPMLVVEDGTPYLEIDYDDAIAKQKTALVTTERLGKTKTSNAAYEQPDGEPYVLDHDYFGKAAPHDRPEVGPFQDPGTGELKLKLWDPAPVNE